jgi:hypothetical protein
MTTFEMVSTTSQLQFEAATIRRFWYEVGHSWLGPVRIPLVVVCGREAGAKLVTLACQHGDEGYGVLGLIDLINEIEPDSMRGELWVLPCVNIFGYTAGHRNSPYDQQDMNRVHPGSAAGTITEQTAYKLQQEIFPGADLIIDLHGGSPENGDSAFAMWSDATDRPPLAPLLARLNLQFLIAQRKQVPGMLSAYTSDVGIPQISIEAGASIKYARENAADMKSFVITAMRYFGMIDGVLPEPKPQKLMRTVTHRAHAGGAFKSLVSFGEWVVQGQRIGVIMDLLGDVVQEVNAIESGVVAVMRTGVRVHPGETVTTLAVPTGETIS